MPDVRSPYTHTFLAKTLCKNAPFNRLQRIHPPDDSSVKWKIIGDRIAPANWQMKFHSVLVLFALWLNTDGLVRKQELMKRFIRVFVRCGFGF